MTRSPLHRILQCHIVVFLSFVWLPRQTKNSLAKKNLFGLAIRHGFLQCGLCVDDAWDEGSL